MALNGRLDLNERIEMILDSLEEIKHGYSNSTISFHHDANMLATCIANLADTVKELKATQAKTNEVLQNNQTEQLRAVKNMVPLKAVIWMFFVLSLSMSGVQAIKYLTQHL